MSTSLLLVIQLLVCCVAAQTFKDQAKVGPEEVIWDVPMYWNNDVYTGRHFDELISSFKGDERRVNRHTVLILYEDDMHDDIISFGMDTVGLPQNVFLNFVKYNYHSTPRHVWYPLLGNDNLSERYIHGKPDPTMPHVVFIKAGSKLDDAMVFPIEEYDMDEEPEQFKNWVWSNLQMHITIFNQLKSTLIVKSVGDGPNQQDFIIEPAHQVNMLTFVSKRVCLHLQETGELAYGLLIEQGMEDIEIAINKSTLFKGVQSNDWLQESNSKVKIDSISRNNYAKVLAEGYLRSFKQPVLSEKFSSVGYQKVTIPKELHTLLLGFYDKNQDTREPGCILGDGNRNGGDISCTTIPIVLEVKQKLADYLSPHVKAWCGRDLEMTHVYGITEFWDTSVMLGMMGKVTDHVLSAELVLKKELGDQPDWELEILDTRGVIQYHHVDVGEMLLYESSSVVIKRPRPFLGRSYVTLGFHYRPKAGWSWRLASEDTVLTNGDVQDNLLILNTPATLRPEFAVKVDEKIQGHTEL